MNFFSGIFKKNPKPKTRFDHQMTSLVALLKEPNAVNLDSTRTLLNAVFDGHFPIKSDDSFVVPGPTPAQLMIKSVVPGHTGIFFLNAVPSPYNKFSDYEDHLSSSELIALAVQSKAWLSIDTIGLIGSEEDAYRFIGKALAAVCPSSTLAVLHPTRYSMIAFTEHTPQRLKATNVLESLAL